ncbi:MULTISPECIES: ATP-binding protein [unclassified Pseudomonas]|uniref:ATP-binding protein n=1 Tax=unclassified Pseudomonas TaxID=196821 RepID=UPI001911D050|nr:MULTISPECIES: ATP-binding protein [unclassified Pseudomonas]MBK5551888.1 hybrid sensor histidine kinase/response regulator [Pseudomonas sp. TH03]MEB0224178.1 ATP-binding protein [Pseudomonas sp. 5S1]MEB0294565.1 ATP-binding protein [Pseudomonas sp. 10S4]WPX18902.1 ATP-binding protein [Pseudomonas sp. 10S4]
MSEPSNRRILLIDDTPSIHVDFRKILTPNPVQHVELDEMEAALFGAAAKSASALFELDSAFGGQEGLGKLKFALKENRPYAMAFVDMRMPDGWDGAQTIEYLWQEDPRLQVVVCTAYSDYSWDELLDRLQAHDRLLILKKPFDNIEVQQMANTLLTKWDMTERASVQMDHLGQMVERRTRQFKEASVELQREIDERKQLESQLVQSEKLASLGQLAAGVAHEINNPIGFISSNLGCLDGYFKQLQEMLDAYRGAEASITSPEVIERLNVLRERVELEFLREDIPLLIKESKDGISRVGQIVKDLKDFSRVDSSQEWQWANLQQGIESTLNIVANELKYKADVVKEYQVLPEIECLPSQINQVIMNLIVNASQAIGPERGVITLRTGLEGETVWIEVADTGSGIEPQCLQKIFDPFFTTKPIGQGTGLGLSLSYGIVKKHHGDISVRSEVGAGTTFRVELPVHQTKAAA